MNRITGTLVFYEGKRYWFPNDSGVYYVQDFLAREAIVKDFPDADEEEVENYRPEGFVFVD